MALFKTLLRWLALGMVGAAAMLALIIAVIAITAPRVDLGMLRPRVEILATQALGRQVVLDGPLAVVLSLPPSVEAGPVRIASSGYGSQADFLRIDGIAASVALIPLLRRQIVVEDMHIDGGEVLLESPGGARRERMLRPGDQPAEGSGWRLAAVNQVYIGNVNLRYRDPTRQNQVELRIDRLTAALPADDAIRAEATGSVGGLPCTVAVRAGSLNDIYQPRGPWPLKASLTLDHNRLQLDGSLMDPPGLRSFAADVEFAGASAADLAALVDASVPEVGAYHIETHIRADRRGVTLSAISGDIGDTRFSGDLALAHGGDRARIVGSLVVEALDAGPWLVSRAPQSGASAPEPSLPSMQRLPAADLQLQIERFLNLPVAVDGVSLTATLEGNALNTKFDATAEGLPIRGQLGIEQSNGVYAANMELHTEQADVGALVDRYTDVGGVAGTLRSLAVRASTRGAGIEALLNNLNVRMHIEDAAMTYGNQPGGTPISVDLDEITLRGMLRRHLHAEAKGRLLGESFTAAIELPDFAGVAAERNLRFNLRATGVGAELSARGRLAGAASEDDTAVEIQVSGERFGALAPWLGVSPDAGARYQLSGLLWVQNDLDAWQLRDLRVRLGRSAIGGVFGRSQLSTRPLLTASLVFGVIDPLELERALVGGQSDESKKTGKGIDVEMPILPKELNLKDMDIDIRGRRLILQTSDVTDIAVSTRIRDGYVAHAPFRATLAETRFTGNIAVDLRGPVAEIKYDLDAADVNVGDFLRELKLANEIDAHADRLTAKVVSRGSSMGELFNDSKIDVEVYSGRWFLEDPNKAGSARIDVIKGTARSDTRKRHTVVELDARIGAARVPMDFTLETQRVTSKSGKDEVLDTTIRARAAGAELTMQGLLPRLRGLRGLDMQLSFRGDRADTLDELLQVSLPPFGPYSVHGRLKNGDSGYGLSDIDIRIGSTSAKGHIDVSTVRQKPQLTARLEAETFQVDDFRLGNWSPAAAVEQDDQAGTSSDRKSVAQSLPTAGGAKNKTTVAPRHEARQQGERVPAEPAQPLLSREVMNSFDGQVELRVGRVVSGQDQLGSGKLAITLEDGKLSLPLHIDVPGGEVALELTLDAKDPEYAATLRAVVENFDYGVFARRIQPGTDMAGKFSVDIEVSSRGETFAQIDNHADGYFDFVIWPQTMRSGIFDLWTANLLFAVLPIISPQTQSKVNCLIGRFNVNDGIMKPDPLFMDTTRTQVKAKGKIDLKTERIELRLTPRSKRPKFFSLSTPVVIEGDFSDFGVNLRPHDLLGTAIRMVSSVVTVPFQYLIRGVRPGVDTGECDKPLGRRAKPTID